MNTSFMRSTFFDKMLTEISCENCYYPENSEYYLDEYQRDGYFYESSAPLKPVIEFCHGKGVWTKKLVKTMPQVTPTTSADSEKGPLKSALKNTKTKSTKKKDKKVHFNIFVDALTEDKQLEIQKLNYTCGISEDETSFRRGAPSKAYVPPHLRRETGGDSMQTQIPGNVEKSKTLLKGSSEEKKGIFSLLWRRLLQGSRSSYHFRRNESQRFVELTSLNIGFVED
jgi:hypothetical protein